MGRTGDAHEPAAAPGSTAGRRASEWSASAAMRDHEVGATVRLTPDADRSAVDDDGPRIGGEQRRPTACARVGWQADRARGAARRGRGCDVHLDPGEAVGGHESPPSQPLARRRPVARRSSGRPSTAGTSPARSTINAPAVTTLAEHDRERRGDDGRARAALRRPTADEHASSPGATKRNERGGKRAEAASAPSGERRHHTQRGPTATRPFMCQTPGLTPTQLGSAAVEAAFFDLDKTVIAKASMVAFGGRCTARACISRRLLLRALVRPARLHAISARTRRSCAHA